MTEWIPGPAETARAQWKERRASQTSDLQAMAGSWRKMKQGNHCSPDTRPRSSPVSCRRADSADHERVNAEAWVLTTEQGQRLLAEASPRPVDPTRRTRAVSEYASAAQVSAAIRLIQARAKAALKFEHGLQMWVDPIAIEQATSELVARHKASRFACPLVVDLCAGIGGDALALAARSDVLAVDLDQGMCRRLGYNALVYNLRRPYTLCSSASRELRHPRRRLAASRSRPPGEWPAACPIARGIRTCAGFLEVGSAASRRGGNQARAGQRFRQALLLAPNMRSS